MAKAVKEEMGGEFVKIYITSVQRSVDSQVEIFMKKLERKSGSQNMFEYYYDHIPEDEDPEKGIPRSVGKSSTLNYLNALQAKFDGINPITVRWKKIPEAHQKEIENIAQKDTAAVKKLLKKYMESGAFSPSSHVGEKKKVTVADLRTKDDHKITAEKIWERNDERGYVSETKGEPHVHLKLD